MILNKIVCSIDLAKKLLTLGVKQNSLFYWFDMGDHRYLYSKDYEQYSKHVNLNIEDGYSAFIAEELAEILPKSLSNEDNLVIYKGDQDYHAYYNHQTHGISYYGFMSQDENLANCLASLLVTVLEKGLMKNEN